MKNRTILKILLLCLSISLLLCPITSCDSNDKNAGENSAQSEGDTKKAPETVEDFITETNQAMSTAAYRVKITDKKIFSGLPSTVPSMDSEEVTTCIIHGSNSMTIVENDGIKTTQTYVDGVLYIHMTDGENGVLNIKKKMTIDAETLSLMGEAAKEFEAIANKIQAESYTIETKEDGNILITGKGTSEEGKAVLGQFFAEVNQAFLIMNLPLTMSEDFSATRTTAVVETGTYRCLSQTSYVKALASLGGIGVTIEATEEQQYTFEEGLTITAPEDADAYKEVQNFAELFTF